MKTAVFLLIFLLPSWSFAAFICQLADQLNHALPDGYTFSPVYKLSFSGCSKICTMVINCDLNGEKYQDTAVCSVNDDGTCPSVADCVQAKGIVNAAVASASGGGASQIIPENPTAPQ